MGHADSSGDLRRFIEEGKKIIISTVQKFPFILDDIGNLHADSAFAIVIDEAHSSQGGRTTRAMNRALGATSSEDEDEDTFEDQINQLIESRKMLANASYFAFTATPKNKTLELFGEPGPATGRHGQAPGLSQLHHEAGHPGMLHHGRAEPIHPHPKLFQRGQEDRGRPGVRRKAGTAQATQVRGKPRLRRQHKGRNHRRPFSTIPCSSLRRWGDKPGPWS